MCAELMCSDRESDLMLVGSVLFRECSEATRGLSTDEAGER